MSAEFEQKEREFLLNLKKDTGRDLAEWMTALDAQDLSERNDRIDWLRHNGFIFAWASWLERIHHNGGRPIYLDAVPNADEAAGKATDDGVTLTTEADPRPSSGRQDEVSNHPRDADAPKPPARSSFDPLAALPSRSIKTDDPEDLGRTIASARAYAPLLNFLLGQIAQRLPEAFAIARRDHVVLHVSKRKAAPFAVIAITASDLKLALNLGSWPIKPPMERARLSGVTAKTARCMSHMIALDDARQVEAGLINLIEAAHRRARTT